MGLTTAREITRPLLRFDEEDATRARVLALLFALGIPHTDPDAGSS